MNIPKSLLGLGLATVASFATHTNPATALKETESPFQRLVAPTKRVVATYCQGIAPNGEVIAEKQMPLEMVFNRFDEAAESCDRFVRGEATKKAEDGATLNGTEAWIVGEEVPTTLQERNYYYKEFMSPQNQ